MMVYNSPWGYLMRRTKRPRKAQLVYEHLENLPATALADYLPLIGPYVRGKTGIYALYRKKHLYYVGLATNLIGRLKTHFRDRHADTWDRFSIYLTKDNKHLKELETLAIRIAAPHGNRMKGTFVRSENLRPRLRRDFRNYQREEMDGVFGGHAQKEIPKSAYGARNKDVKGVVVGQPLTAYIHGKLKIRMPYKGKIYHGVIRKDGIVRCEKGLFASLSGAAKTIAGNKSMDGWYWWKYKDTNGDWIPVANLRKK
jgi:hypothetical protein